MPSARYEIIRQLACGGMAEVLLARRIPDDGSPPEVVVIKRVLPHLTQADGFMRMFATESRIASQLRHPNIVAVVEVGEMDHLPFIAMERLDGADLLRLLQQCVLRRQQLGTAVAMAIVAGAARGLGYAHRARARDGRPLKIIHRDVSPHNIFVTRDGGVKLLDFGIAKSAAQATNTHTGQVKGKISYMSPEQIRAQPLDARSDLWSLGVVLWESVAGEKLFTRDNDAATLHAILHDPIPALARPEAPGLDELIAAVLQRDPAKRIGTAEEIARRLDALLARAGHTHPHKLIAQRVASLVPALSPEIDTARPPVLRNPEVVTFAVGPALARSDSVREAASSARAGAHRRLSISKAPVAEAPPADEDDPTLLEIAAPPPDSDFDPEETLEREGHPRVGETTDTHTIPLRPAIQATGTGGGFASVARAVLASASVPVPASGRPGTLAPPRRPVLPASIEAVAERLEELDPESDESLTAPLRRPPTLAMPADKAPRVAPRPVSVAQTARAQGGNASQGLSADPEEASTVPSKARSSLPVPPPPVARSSVPASSKGVETVGAPTARSSEAPPSQRPSTASSSPLEPPKTSTVREATLGSSSRPSEGTGSSDLLALFGAPPLPASPSSLVEASVPQDGEARPSTELLSEACPSEASGTTHVRRTQRIDTVRPPSSKGRVRVLALALGGLCAVAGLVVLGAYMSGSLKRHPSHVATTTALEPSRRAPSRRTEEGVVAPAVASTGELPPASPLPVLPSEPTPVPLPAPSGVAVPSSVSRRTPAMPPTAATRPVVSAPTRVGARPPGALARPATTPRPAVPTPPATARGTSNRTTVRATPLHDPFETLANGASATAVRPPSRPVSVRDPGTTPTHLPSPSATPVRTLVPRPPAPPSIRTPVPRPPAPPSVRSGVIFHEL